MPTKKKTNRPDKKKAIARKKLRPQSKSPSRPKPKRISQAAPKKKAEKKPKKPSKTAIKKLKSSRLRFIKQWKTSRLSKQIKAERQLNKFVDRMMRKFPGDYMNKIKEGLEDNEKFKQAMDVVEGSPFGTDGPIDDEVAEEFLETFTRKLKLDE